MDDAYQFCTKPIHCCLCAFIIGSELGIELCLTCAKQTQPVDNTTGQKRAAIVMGTNKQKEKTPIPRRKAAKALRPTRISSVLDEAWNLLHAVAEEKGINDTNNDNDNDNNGLT